MLQWSMRTISNRPRWFGRGAPVQIGQTDSAVHWLRAFNEVASRTGREVPVEMLLEAEGNHEGLRQRVGSMTQAYLERERLGAIEIARFHARLKDWDSTFVWLDKVSWNVERVNYLLYESPFDPIRSDAPYTALLKRIGVR